MKIERFVNNEKYGFQSDKIKVEFSNPHIQPSDENAFCKSERSILYYYYTLTVYIKEKKRWQHFFTAHTHDFPEILTFKEILKQFLDGIELENYQKNKIDEGIWYSYYLDITGWADDKYGVYHSFLDLKDEIRQNNYKVSIAKPLANFIGFNNISVELENLDKEDLLQIYRTVSDFIDYSIHITNEEIIERNKADLLSWKSEGGKLYKMMPDGKSIESIYVVGDKIDNAILLHGDINTEDFWSYEICNFTIDAITEDAIVLSSGFEYDDRHGRRDIESSEQIKLNCLLNLYDDMPKERLCFNEEQIKEDFKGILSDKEKVEFIESSADFLFDKWKSAIIDRTWMCRDEHNLPKRVESDDRHDNVYASIRVIIDKLKDELWFESKL